MDNDNTDLYGFLPKKQTTNHHNIKLSSPNYCVPNSSWYTTNNLKSQNLFTYFYFWSNIPNLFFILS